MKKTSFKDSLKNISKRKISFLSIVIIGMMSLASFTGLNFASGAIRDALADYYSRTGFRDFQVVSSLLLSEEDLDLIRQTDGVADVEGEYIIPASAVAAGTRCDVQIVNLTQRINRVEVLEGELPAAPDECALEKDFMEKYCLAVGDSIKAAASSEQLEGVLRSGTFRITAKVMHPDHFAAMNVFPEDRYVLVSEEAIDADALSGRYMAALVAAEKPEGLSCFSGEYKELSARMLPVLEDVAARLSQEGNAQVLSAFDEQMDGAKTQLDEGRRQLDESKEKLDESAEKLKESENELIRGEAELDLARGELESARPQLDQAKEKIDAGKKELSSGRKTLDEAAEKLRETYREIEEKELDITAAIRDALRQYAGDEYTDGINWITSPKEADISKASLSALDYEIAEGITLHMKSTLDETIDGARPLVSGVTGAGLIEQLAQYIKGTEEYRSVDEIYESFTGDMRAWDRRHSEYVELLERYNGGDTQVSADTLSDMRSELQSEYLSLQFYQSLIRSLFKSTLSSYVGSDLVDLIKWAEPNYFFDVDDPELTATDIRLTNLVTIPVKLSCSDMVDIGAQMLLSVTPEGPVADLIIAAAKELPVYDTLSSEYSALYDKLQEWDRGHKEYLDGLEQYSSSSSELDRAIDQYNSGEEEYAKGKDKYDEGMSAYADGKKAYEDGLRQYDEGRTKYLEGEAEYSEALSEYEKGLGLRDDLPEDYVYVYDISGNLSYNSTVINADNLFNLGMTFSLLFVLIAALVIFTTISRLVSEDRKYIGTQKALGFFRREIYKKYLLFGLASTACGMLAGTLAGFLIVQRSVLEMQCNFFIVDSIRAIIDWRLEAIVVILGLVMAFAVVLLSCRSLIRESARALLQPEMPKTASGRGASSKQGGSLYSRLIRRNMKADMKRVIVTVVSVTGCCTLLTIGLSTRNNVSEGINRQFTEMSRYDYVVYYDSGSGAGEEIRDILDERNAVHTQAYICSCVMKIGKTNAGVQLFCPADNSLGLIGMNDSASGDDFTLPDMGITVTEAFSRSYGIEKADTVVLIDPEMKPHTLYVTGIVKNYIGSMAYMSPAAYEMAFGSSYAPNAFIVSSADGRAELEDALGGVEGFDKIEASSDLRKTYTSANTSIDGVIALLFLAAALMAVFVLLNIVNMHLATKKKELTVMRINGFTTRETINYILREGLATTAVGTVLGLAAGHLITMLILHILRQPSVEHYYGVNPLMLLIAAAMTALYSGVIYFIATRKIKRLKLADMA